MCAGPPWQPVRLTQCLLEACATKHTVHFGQPLRDTVDKLLLDHSLSSAVPVKIRSNDALRDVVYPWESRMSISHGNASCSRAMESVNDMGMAGSFILVNHHLLQQPTKCFILR